MRSFVVAYPNSYWHAHVQSNLHAALCAASTMLKLQCTLFVRSCFCLIAYVHGSPRS
eukprot:m.364203 g.364203  ORF g.364203 m.364203 type:complete len:57 (-) comp19965_c1_seq2:437-607(-)